MSEEKKVKISMHPSAAGKIEIDLDPDCPPDNVYVVGPQDKMSFKTQYPEVLTNEEMREAQVEINENFSKRLNEGVSMDDFIDKACDRIEKRLELWVVELFRSANKEELQIKCWQNILDNSYGQQIRSFIKIMELYGDLSFSAKNKPPRARFTNVVPELQPHPTVWLYVDIYVDTEDFENFTGDLISNATPDPQP